MFNIIQLHVEIHEISGNRNDMECNSATEELSRDNLCKNGLLPTRCTWLCDELDSFCVPVLYFSSYFDDTLKLVSELCFEYFAICSIISKFVFESR